MRAPPLYRSNVTRSVSQQFHALATLQKIGSQAQHAKPRSLERRWHLVGNVCSIPTTGNLLEAISGAWPLWRFGWCRFKGLCMKRVAER